MRLVLYSGADLSQNYLVDKELFRLVGKKRDITFSLIPSQSYNSELEYIEFIEHYGRMGIDHLLHFPIDIPLDEVLKLEVFNSDIIHLGGGNTYYFLYWLKKTKLLDELIKFVKKGGILCGTSAGALMMSPTIEAAGFPHFDCDENEENLRDFKSLNLTNFDFFPHYCASKKLDKSLCDESKKRKLPLWAVEDGGGIVVVDDKLTFIGKTVGFYRGEKIKVIK